MEFVRPCTSYLDDYLLFGDPESQECAEALKLAVKLCEYLGVPIANLKLEGPVTVVVFLGIRLDTAVFEIRLPQNKLVHLQALIRSWCMKNSCNKRELLSLIRHLQHACRVVPPGRSFLRTMIELSTKAKELHHHNMLKCGFSLRSSMVGSLSCRVEWDVYDGMQVSNQS